MPRISPTRRPLMESPSYAPTILTGGHDKLQSGPHSHPAGPDYGLWVLRAGQWELRRRGERRLLRAPCAVLIEPGADLSLIVHGSTDRIFLKFSVVRQPRRPGLGPRPQPSSETVWGIRLPSVVPSDRTLPCLRMVGFCCDQWWRGPLQRARANAHLSDWLAAYALGQMELSNPPPTEWKEHCCLLARQRLHSCLNVRQWAQAAGMSRQRFSARFAAEAGVTPQRYLAEARFEQACALLRDTDRTVRHIALQCGFRSPGTLARFLRARTGHGPRRWRIEHRMAD